ncbi:MAG: hypothetical protein J7M34_07890 [Anaerolineae bacterium]|nr:hypothetical protein [Anaerolineae bacterium]
MKNHLLIPLFVLVFVLASAVAPTARAQESPIAPECFNLSADDCAFLMTALAKTGQDVTSFNQSFHLQVTLNGWMGQADTNDFTLDVKGHGPFIIDPAKALQNPLAAVSAMLDMQATSSGGGQRLSSMMDIRYVDSTGYWTDPATGQWLGLSADEVMGLMAMAAGLAAQPEQLAKIATPAGAPIAPAVTKEAVDLSADLATTNIAEVLPTPSFVVNYVRKDDVKMMGRTLSPFSLDLDMAPLLASKQFQSFLVQVLSTAGQGDQDPGLLMAAQMAPTVLDHTSVTLNVTLWVGEDDMLLHKVTLDMQTAVDVDAVLGLGKTGAGPATVEVHADVTLDHINQHMMVSAPEHATMLAPSGLSAALMQ